MVKFKNNVVKFNTLSEMKYSRIFFDKQPPQFMSYFTWCIVLILISSFYMTSIIQKNYIVKGVGNIVSSDKVAFSSKVAGVVSIIHKQEGESVKKGELLLTFTVGSEKVQSVGYAKQIEVLKEQMNAQDIYERSLSDKKNYLQNTGVQQAYFGKIEYYLAQVKSDSENTRLQQEKIVSKKKEKQDIIDKINELNKNQQVHVAEIEVKKQELKTVDEEIKKLTTENSSADKNSQTIYNQLISELGAERIQVNLKKQELESQYNIQIVGDEQLKIYASIDGYVHYNKPASVGSAVQLGEQLGTISGGAGSKLRVEAYIQAVERAKIQENSDVKLAIVGLNQAKYGMLKGKVLSIGLSPLVQETEKGQVQVFQVVIELDDQVLRQNQQEYHVYSGLSVESQVVYDKETYLDWILEQLNLKG